MGGKGWVGGWEGGDGEILLGTMLKRERERAHASERGHVSSSSCDMQRQVCGEADALCACVCVCV